MRSSRANAQGRQYIWLWLKTLLVFWLVLCGGIQAEAQPTSGSMYDGYTSVTVPYAAPFGWGGVGVSGNPPSVNMQLGYYPDGGNPNPIHPFAIDTGSIGITVSTPSPGANLVAGQYFKPGANDILVYSNVSTHYSSSNLTETGSAYLTNVGIFDPTSNLRATARVLVMAVTQESCTDGSQSCAGVLQSGCAGFSPCAYPKFISYSGVGFRAGMAFAQSPTDMLNPFTSLISIAGVPDAKIRQGYIISSTGVTLGLSAAATQNFAFIKLGNYTTATQPNNVNWAYPLGVLTINGVSGTAQILVDTGIGQMYLTPAPGVVYARGTGANALPANSNIQIAIPGMDTAFGMSYDFTTGSLTNPMAPLSYFVTSKTGTVDTAFVNTGRDVIQGYNYLYDADGGYVGFSWNGSLSSQFEQFAPALTLLGTVPLANGFATNLPTMLLQNTSLSTSGTAMLAGNISGPGSLTLTGGTLSLTGNNTYTGGTQIAGGTLSISSDSNLGASSGPLIFSGGALQTISTMTTARAVTLNSAAIIQPAINTTLTMSGTIAGTGGLKMSGEGTLVLTGNNTYTGTTEVASGTLSVSNDNNLGAGTDAVILSGGTLQVTGNMNSARSLALSSIASFQPDANTTLALSGALTGSGGILMMGDGTLALSGTNSFSGGTGVFSGTLAINGASPLGTGPVYIAAGATLLGTGTIAGPLAVGGTLKPGNSPGYLATNSTVNMLSGSTYVQDIAGNTQANATTPTGSSGNYSFLKVSGGTFAIESGAKLTPRLQNLFSLSESGYGSAPYTPVVGDKFRIITADGGIFGKFTTLIQPAGLASGTQFLQFYNYNGSNSLDLAVAPSSFNTAVASSGNKNAQSVGSALDRMVVTNQSGTATTAQDALLYTASGQSLAGLPSFTQGMAGEIYGATLAVVPQTSQRIQQAVISRLGDTMSAPMMAGTMAAGTNTAISATNPGGQPTASMSSNPNVNPYASGAGGMSMSNGAAWGEVAYQYGNRSSDNNSGGWTSNLVQAVVGVDMYSDGGTKAGGGVALSNTNVSASQGSGTVQQGSLFLYGKLPVQQFVVDAMASYGFNSTNNSRNDATGLTSGLTAKNVQGNDALVSLGLNLPIDLDNSRVTPYIRATWQQVNQNGFNEGTAASALTIKSFNNNGVRGVIGVAAGSKAVDPIKEQTTYRVNVGLGVDSTNVLNPQLSASLAGMTTTINTPSAGAAFVQAGMYGTVKFADNAFAYAGVTAEARSGQVLAGGNIGVRIQF